MKMNQKSEGQSFVDDLKAANEPVKEPRRFKVLTAISEIHTTPKLSEAGDTTEEFEETEEVVMQFSATASGETFIDSLEELAKGLQENWQKALQMSGSVDAPG
jgi:hypothetical protein